MAEGGEAGRTFGHRIYPLVRAASRPVNGALVYPRIGQGQAGAGHLRRLDQQIGASQVRRKHNPQQKTINFRCRVRPRIVASVVPPDVVWRCSDIRWMPLSKQRRALGRKRSRIHSHPGNFRRQPPIFDFRAAIHHHLDAGIFRKLCRLVVAHAKLHPDHLRHRFECECLLDRRRAHVRDCGRYRPCRPVRGCRRAVA